VSPVSTIRATLGPMDTAIRSVDQRDWGAVTAIFNHFVVNSLAAYPEEPVAADFFAKKHSATPDYPFLVAEAVGTMYSGFPSIALASPRLPCWMISGVSISAILDDRMISRT